MRKSILTILMAGLLAGCMSSNPYADHPDSVVVISYPAGRPAEVLRVTSPHLVSHLEGLFPGYKDLPSSDTAGGWEAVYEVYFNFGGKSLRVISDGQDWSNGHGDTPVKGRIDKVLKTIRE